MRLPVDDLNRPVGVGALDAHAAAGGRRERLRFTRFSCVRTPNARCAAEVELEYQPGDSVVGRAEGISAPLGDVRLAAEATLRAIEDFSRGTVKFDLLGVKQMRAFDANVVIVSVHCVSGDVGDGEHGRERRLLGCHLADEDPLRGAVIATLQATNRMLRNAIATR
ncbi:MAG TPA: hypothetical protein VFV33_02885 [Gemmatimonadaceae bacterium]|nr:hypothetical protein [Gemmatimonadaceae bacterium]